MRLNLEFYSKAAFKPLITLGNNSSTAGTNVESTV